MGWRDEWNGQQNRNVYSFCAMTHQHVPFLLMPLFSHVSLTCSGWLTYRANQSKGRQIICSEWVLSSNVNIEISQRMINIHRKTKRRTKPKYIFAISVWWRNGVHVSARLLVVDFVSKWYKRHCFYFQYHNLRTNELHWNWIRL